MKKYLLPILLGLFGVIHASATLPEYIDLSGQWQVALDSLDCGEQYGYSNAALPDVISLPGTTDDAGLGRRSTLTPELTKPQLLRLTRKHSYIGPAWYTRTISIPSTMAEKPLDIEFERVMWSSQLWLDGKKIDGFNESLTTPHRFFLPDGLSQGEHRITIRIDNRKRYDISVKELAHSYTDDTQIKWNGVLGRMRISVRNPVAITDLQIYPDITNGTASIKASVYNTSDKSIKKKLYFSVLTQSGVPIGNTTIKSRLNPGENIISAIIKPTAAWPHWDEFSPTLLKAIASIDNVYNVEAVRTFGLREITSDSRNIKVNGRPVFLRGTLECCIFPLTGTPPTTVEGWQKVLTTARNWGLNHLRFHSWCPPEAAFRVADRMGFYLQVELPFWSESLMPEDTDVKNFLCNEFGRISREYGNHPSLCLLSVGNEIRHDFTWLNSQVAYMKEKDPRHIYTTSSFTFESNHGIKPEPEDDFFVTQWTADGWVRGQGVFDSESPAFNKNFASAMGCVDKPLISHEIGQYAIFPNISEIQKYTGTLDPLNFKAIKLDLQQKGLAHLADTFTQASGRFAALLYKEEIERAMKTPGFSGYQLLGLQDFPGQGTALVGLVDAFWDSKEVTTPDEFRRFASPIVPLASFPKAVYCDRELFEANIDMANFSASDIADTNLYWRLSDGLKTIASDSLPIHTAKTGGLTNIGSITAPLHEVTNPTRFTLTLNVGNTDYHNNWSIWYYPQIDDISSGSVVQTSDPDVALVALQQGAKVLYSPAPDSIKGLECKFLPVFWSPVHFPKQAAGMGIYTNPAHPALASFPTDMNTDWQWWRLLKNATTVNLDSLSISTLPEARLMPIVGIIDNFVNNRNLGLIVEARCGNGQIILSAIDLLSTNVAQYPEIQWMRQSLLNYMNSESFAPKREISLDKLRKLTGSNTTHATTPTSIYN